jgi:hypothetical protein
MLLDAQRDEYRWRAAQLDATTVPTEGIVSNRNANRNAPLKTIPCSMPIKRVFGCSVVAEHIQILKIDDQKLYF